MFNMSTITLQNNTYNLMCRLCLSSEDNLISIFEESYSFLPQRIAACINVEIYVTDQMPTTICKSCYTKVEEWFDFKQRCDDSQSKLRQWASINNILCNKNKSTPVELKEEVQPDLENQIRIIENSICVIKDEPFDTYENPLPSDTEENQTFVSSPQPCQFDEDEDPESLLVPSYECPVSAHGMDAPMINQIKGSQLKLLPSRKCRECFKMFSNVANRQRHERNVHGMIVHSDLSQSSDSLESENMNTHSLEYSTGSNNTVESNDVTIQQFAASLHLVKTSDKLSKPMSEKHFIEFNTFINQMITRLKCVLCGAGFSSRKALTAHIAKLFVLEKFSCYSCCISFGNMSQYMKHLRQMYCKQRARLIQDKDCLFKAYQHYQCSICQQLFVHKMLLNSHLVNSHLLPKHPQSCERCDKLFQTDNEYKEHIQDSCFYKIYCSICKSCFDNETFTEHCKIHDYDDTEFCIDDYIDKKYDCRNKFKALISNENNVNMYSCSICGDQFPNLDLWCEHQQIHSDNNVNRCTECNRVFVTEFELEQHKTTHSNNNIKLKLLRCSDTNSYKAVSEFSSSSNSPQIEVNNDNFDKNQQQPDHVQDNLKIEEVFKCNTCKKVFLSERSLRSHKRLHINVHVRSYKLRKKYICQKCGKISWSVGVYRIHTRKCNLNKENTTISSPPVSIKKEYFRNKENTTISSPSASNMKESKDNFSPSMSYKKETKENSSPSVSYKKESKENASPSLSNKKESTNENSSPSVNIKKESDKKSAQTLSCLVCKKKFVTKSGYLYHKQYVHKHTNKNLKTYQCDVCNKVFSNLLALYGHIKLHKNEDFNTKLNPEYTFECKTCNKSFLTHKGLAIHTKKHELYKMSPKIKIKTEPGLETFNCNFCNMNFGSRPALNSHVKIHLNGTNVAFNCTFCDKVCANSYQLATHVQAKHSDENTTSVRIKKEHSTHRCPICKKNFQSDGILKKHLIIHAKTSVPTVPKKFRCPECNKSFISLKALRTHQNWHAKPVKPFFHCSECDDKFDNKKDYIHHLKMHKKIFKCKLCPKVFTYMKSLLVHCALIHDDENEEKTKSIVKNPVKCKSNIKVKTEIKQEQTKSMYRCTECNTTFVNSAKLRAHVLSMHMATDM